MNRRHLLLVAAGVATLAVAATFTAKRQRIAARVASAPVAPEPERAAREQPAETPHAVDYKVARIINSTSEQKTYLYVFVEPQHFVREKMMALARRLNHDFPDRQRVMAFILDDEHTARHFNPVAGEDEIFWKACRGEYHLDRLEGEEYIQFSTRRGMKTDEMKVNLRRVNH